MAVSKYDKENLTQSQQDEIANVTLKAEAGEMSWEDAHAQAESVRNGYGYSGGGDGSEYNQFSSGKNQSYQKPFSYESAPSYANKYQGQIDAITKEILNREAFSYDPEKDDTYKQYKESYTRNGQRAMQDTLGQVSARTGGLASSYAGNASQQTYDNYMGALADKIPELKQLAYSMYRDEGSDQRANLDMLQALESGDYNKYLGLLGQYNTDRNFGYQTQRDEVADGRYENEWDYNVGRDEVSDKRYEDETAYNRGNYKSEKEYNIALQKAQTLAAGGDFSGYQAMGYTAAEIGNLKSAYNKAQAGTGTGRGGSSGGGSSGNSGGGASGGTSGGIVETMVGMGSDTKAYEYLLGLEMSNAKTEQLWGMYESSRGDESSGGKGDIASSVTNQVDTKRGGSDWIRVPGFSRLTWAELESMVDRGAIIETYDKKTKKYTYKKNPNKS